MFHDLREVEEEGVFVAAGVGLEADWEAARGARYSFPLQAILGRE